MESTGHLWSLLSTAQVGIKLLKDLIIVEHLEGNQLPYVPMISSLFDSSDGPEGDHMDTLDSDCPVKPLITAC